MRFLSFILPTATQPIQQNLEIDSHTKSLARLDCLKASKAVSRSWAEEHTSDGTNLSSRPYNAIAKSHAGNAGPRSRQQFVRQDSKSYLINACSCFLEEYKVVSTHGNHWQLPLMALQDIHWNPILTREMRCFYIFFTAETTNMQYSLARWTDTATLAVQLVERPALRPAVMQRTCDCVLNHHDGGSLVDLSTADLRSTACVTARSLTSIDLPFATGAAGEGEFCSIVASNSVFLRTINYIQTVTEHLENAS